MGETEDVTEHLTGIFIRAEIDGKWQSVDIADGRLPVGQLVEWLRSGPPEKEMAVRVCLLLLGRDQNAVEGVPRVTAPPDERAHPREYTDANLVAEYRDAEELAWQDDDESETAGRAAHVAGLRAVYALAALMVGAAAPPVVIE